MSEEKAANESEVGTNSIWRSSALAVVSTIIGIASAIGAYAILPYRMTEAEKRIAVLENVVNESRAEFARQSELLARIDERLKGLQGDMRDLKSGWRPFTPGVLRTPTTRRDAADDSE